MLFAAAKFVPDLRHSHLPHQDSVVPAILYWLLASLLKCADILDEMAKQLNLFPHHSVYHRADLTPLNLTCVFPVFCNPHTSMHASGRISQDIYCFDLLTSLKKGDSY